MNKYYKEFFEDAGLGYFIWDLKTNKGYFSKIFTNMIGYAGEDFNNTETNWLTYIHPDDIQEIKQKFKNYLFSTQETSFCHEYRFIHKKGHFIWVKTSGRIIEHDANGKPALFIGSHIDITEQKNQEENILATKRLLEKSNTLAKIGIWEYNRNNNFIETHNINSIFDEPQLNQCSIDQLYELLIKQCSNQSLLEEFKKTLNTPYQFELETDITTHLHRSKSIRIIGNSVSINNNLVVNLVFQDITPLKKTLAQLAFSQNQFWTAYNSSTIGMAIISLQGNIVDMNDYFCNLLAYSKSYLLNKPFNDLFISEDQQEEQKYFSDLQIGNIDGFQLEARLITHDHTIAWVKATYAIVRNINQEVSHYIIQLIDISKNKEYESEIIKTNQELTAILSSRSDVAIISTDINGIITKFNKGAEILLGYTKEEIINKKTPLHFHTKEEIKKRNLELQKLFKAPIPDIDTITLYAKNGRQEIKNWTYVSKNKEHIPVQICISAIKNSQNEITGYLSIAIDNRLLIYTKNALKESEQKLSIALEGAGVGIFDYWIQKNKIYLSNNYNDLFGYTASQKINDYNDWSSKIHPEDLRGLMKEFKKHEHQKSSVFLKEVRIKCADSSYKWTILRCKITQFKNGFPERVIGTFADITIQKQKQEELQQALDLVSEQNKRLLNFTYIVSHNLRTHIANFELGFNLLNDESTSPEEKIELIENIKNISEKLGDTIKNLNEVIAIQTNTNIKKKKLNLNEYINKTIPVLESLLEKRHVQIINKVNDQVFIHFNPAYLESIIINFLTNAIKYRHPDRQAYVMIEHEVLKDKKHRILFKDNGIGIDLHRHQSDLYGMYKTFHRNKDAKGIGLFITKNQIEAMGGSITVESEVGVGTTFIITLP
jgi:PAS domain S-box-containing protein